MLQCQSRLVLAVPDELPAGVLPFHREGHRVPPGKGTAGLSHADRKAGYDLGRLSPELRLSAAEP